MGLDLGSGEVQDTGVIGLGAATCGTLNAPLVVMLADLLCEPTLGGEGGRG